jgi:hypothetical protein
MSPLLTLNAFDRAIGGFLVGLGVQCHPHRKATRRIFSNYLDAGNDVLTEIKAKNSIPDQDDCHLAQHNVLLAEMAHGERSAGGELLRCRSSCHS